MGLREYLIAMYVSEAAAAFIMIVMWLSESVLKLGLTAVIAAAITIYFHIAYIYLSGRQRVT